MLVANTDPDGARSSTEAVDLRKRSKEHTGLDLRQCGADQSSPNIVSSLSRAIDHIKEETLQKSLQLDPTDLGERQLRRGAVLVSLCCAGVPELVKVW